MEMFEVKCNFRIRIKYWEFSSVGSEHSDLLGRVVGSIAKIYWEFSSVGSEHLPYKQRVGGSNPSTPTIIENHTSGKSTGLTIQVVKNVLRV